MASLINVPVLWNETDTFLNGQIYVIDAASRIVGVFSKPSQVYPTGYQHVQYTDCVKVVTPDGTILFIDLTLSQYLALVAAASVPVGENELVLSATIGDSGYPAGTEIQNDGLIGATIVLLVVNGVAIYIPRFTFDSVTGTITTGFSLADDDTIQINYFKA